MEEVEVDVGTVDLWSAVLRQRVGDLHVIRVAEIPGETAKSPKMWQPTRRLAVAGGVDGVIEERPPAGDADRLRFRGQVRSRRA
jgi:hypothetical protein